MTQPWAQETLSGPQPLVEENLTLSMHAIPALHLLRPAPSPIPTGGAQDGSEEPGYEHPDLPLVPQGPGGEYPPAG